MASPWLLLAYRLPREPSAPRVAVWRALKALDGAYLLDGAFVVANTAFHATTLGHLAHDIRNWGGEASLLEVAGVDDERRFRALLRPEERAPRKAKRR